MSDNEEEINEEEQKPKYDYEEKDEENFKKQEKIIYDLFMKAKEDHFKENKPEDGEEPEPFPEEDWSSTLIEEKSYDEKVVKLVTKLGIYAGNRNEFNSRTGEGKSLFPNGDIYIGEYKENERNGKGKYIYKNLGTNEIDDKIEKILNENKQIQNIKQNKPINEDENNENKEKEEEKEEKEEKEEEEKEKEVIDPEIIQQKIIKYLNKNKLITGITNSYLLHSIKGGKYQFYEGDFKNNLKDGKGIMKFKNGGIYIGEWKNNFKHGNGKMIFPSGDIYEGEFKEGIRDGEGRYFFLNSCNVFKGKFSKGDIISGVWEMCDGTSYTGKFEKNQPQDLSTNAYFTFNLGKNNATIKGEMKNGFWNPLNKVEIK